MNTPITWNALSHKGEVLVTFSVPVTHITLTVEQAAELIKQLEANKAVAEQYVPEVLLPKKSLAS